MFLRLGKMLIDADEIFAMAFLRMVPNQNWLTERNLFKLFPGSETAGPEGATGAGASGVRSSWRLYWVNRQFSANR